MSDFKPNKLSFNVAACMNTIKDLLNLRLDTLSHQLVNIVCMEIQTNGNGSSEMRALAIRNVKETKREITNDRVLLEVGIDTDSLKDNEEVFVNVSVVLHGNMKGNSWTWRDAAVMYTKPGVVTYGKENGIASDKRVHVPKWYKPRAMPGFAQQDVSKYISENTDVEINHHVEDFMNIVSRDIDNFDWSQFVIVR